MDMENKARELLAARAGDASVEGGLALRPALKQARLDDSMESLDRVQALLAQIRRQYQPTSGQWSADAARENFLLLLAFHMGELLSRHAREPVRWMAYDQALDELPADVLPPPASWSRVLGLMREAVVVPLGVLEDHLFNPQPGIGCRAYVQRLVDRARAVSATSTALPSPVQILRLNATRAPGQALPPAWQVACAQAGFLLACGMSIAQGKLPVWPKVLTPQPDGQARLTDFSFHGDAAEALKLADEQMAANSEGAPWQVMLFDGHATVPDERLDALTVDLRCYGAGAQALQARISCPYRGKDGIQPFHISSPKLLACSAPPLAYPELFRHFCQALERFEAEGFSWRRFLDERT
jgi:hypothetical protein